MREQEEKKTKIFLTPDASQEGLLWPWKGYASVALFHFHVPEESTRATFEFASFQGLYDYQLKIC